MKNNQLYTLILKPYNEHWTKPKSAFDYVPKFHRPVFYTLNNDIKQIPQMLSITGPRRIGKSTLLFQLIQQLIKEGVEPNQIIYYSFDDPALYTQKIEIDEFINYIMKLATTQNGKSQKYLFFDEIQKLERWELYLKKYYDLKYPIKVVISGSASSPIFKKSRESLLGRIKDYHLLPFSFREYALLKFKDENQLIGKINDINNFGKHIKDTISEAPFVEDFKENISIDSTFKKLTDETLDSFFLEGGFPEVWAMPSWAAKQEYLYDNQIKKVIYEDLVLAAEFRKPELLKQFYLSLLEMPGREVNIQDISKETEVKSSQIDKYLPLLEMTDFIYHISKFRKGSLRVRKGLMKFYLVDLALRNAVMRLNESLLKDYGTLGYYAENLVFLALKKWIGVLQIDYYRERNDEVDFIVHTAPNRFLPIEVKYRNKIDKEDYKGINKFISKYKNNTVFPLLITKNSTKSTSNNIITIPLSLFLLLFD